MTVDRELLDLLGLPDEGALRLETSVVPGPERTAEAAGVKDFLALLAAVGSWADLGPPDLPVYREAAYVAVAAEQPIEVLSGTPVEAADVVGFDTGRERVVLRLRTEQGRTYVIDGRAGRVDTYTLNDALNDALADLPDVAAPLPALVAPDIADWCARTAAEPWLAEAAATCAASPSSVDRLAAVGLLARLWTEPVEAVAATTPRALARTWAASLPPASLGAAESAAVRRAWDLAERIAGVADLPEALADAEVAAIVTDRDDLASVRRALRLAGAGGRLAEALVAVDGVAAEHMSALSDRLPHLADDPDADRWHAVAWQEPDAWWVGA